MSGEKRLSVMPSRMVLQGIKERAAAARKGHDLLKRKSDAIKMNLNSKLKQILTVKRRVGESMRKSAFAHTEAVWAAGDINKNVLEGAREASYKIRASLGNVAGVKLPLFARVRDEAPGKETMVGLVRGGEKIQQCRQSFLTTLEDLVELASLQTSVKTLDDALKVTNRRVNALEFVILPTMVNTIKYIQSEMDELEREDQYRIKKVKDLRVAEEEIASPDGEQLTAEEAANLRLQREREREEEARKLEEARSVLSVGMGGEEAGGEEDIDITGDMLS